MIAQGEALRLADELSKSHLNHYVNHAAAAELRRLAKVEIQRDALLEALLEALKRIVDWDAAGLALTEDHLAQARAAIAKAEENT